MAPETKAIVTWLHSETDIGVLVSHLMLIALVTLAGHLGLLMRLLVLVDVHYVYRCLPTAGEGSLRQKMIRSTVSSHWHAGRPL